MAIVMKELSAAVAGKGDMFLHVQAKRAGKIKGEALQPGFENDILVRGWNWGVSATSALGHTQALSRRSYSALTVTKSIDLATVGLMAALATNDEIKEARLSMRKAGGEQEVYFVIRLEGARIAGVDHVAMPDGTADETVQIVFNKVEVEYRTQKSAGIRGGSATFSDELSQQD
jgi:type VI secretion system secreted protein Hcp